MVVLAGLTVSVCLGLKEGMSTLPGLGCVCELQRWWQLKGQGMCAAAPSFKQIQRFRFSRLRFRVSGYGATAILTETLV